ncbi:MAG: TrkH family potassium uptake protein [Bacteroidales bacterium]|nr:TrkH family potassium uptake protein [Bacteroidales bacterium]
MTFKSKINHPLVLRFEGLLLLIEGLFMLTVLPVTYLQRGLYAFSMPFSALITLLTGLILLITTRKHKNDKTSSRDGVYTVCISWLVLSLFGSMPYLLSKSVPNFTDGFFEALSGFTTTGATILPHIEAVPKDILLWRSMTQWIGGLAIIVFSIAILPYLGMSGMQLFVAEINGLNYDKLHPRIMHTVWRIWGLYLFFTLLETLLLYWGDMNFYEALCHSLSTISSGGFSTRTGNIGEFSNYSQVVVSVFMVLSGCNFSLLLLSLSWRSFAIFRNQEFRTFLLYTVLLGLGIGLVLLLVCNHSFGAAFRESFFSVISAFTTTGFFVSDYTLWPSFLWVILFLLMFIGACSGSTSGGVKLFRHLIFINNSWLELKRIIHPNAVVPVKVNGKSISQSGVYKNMTFIFIYFLVFIIGAIVLLAFGLNFETSIGASVATLSNVGTGIGQVGPGGSYVAFPMFTKWVLMLFMLLGRVELFALITLLSRSFWKN